jgi:UDP-N-acetylmuramoyl-L-alanyl-D-glutamate--2,6-diaminopimelate ligase
MSMTLNELLLEYLSTPLLINPIITGMALDSREIKPGNLFVACNGSIADGQTYITAAQKNGAVAVITEADSNLSLVTYQNKIPIITIPNLKEKIGLIAAQYYQYPTKKLAITGITGTSGKTSCAHFFAQALQKLNQPCGIVGTLGNGIYGDISPSHLTTPDAITLQKLFANFINHKAAYAVMEVSSHSIVQHRISGIEFAIGIFTNLSRDHLDYHANMAEYGKVKQSLFAHTRQAIINADDEFGQQIITDLLSKSGDAANNKSLLAYSVKPLVSNNYQVVYASDYQCNADGFSAFIHTPWGEGPIQVKLIGQFNLSNVLAVIAALGCLQIPFTQILTAVSLLSAVPGRMQLLGGGNKPLVVVDYAHKPDALEKVLRALREHCHGKLLCVFGCGGDRDRGKRPLMAAVAEKYADHILITNDNPRHENPAEIIADIQQGFSASAQFIIEPDRSKAISDVIQYAKAGDCILIAGKGAETYQQIGSVKMPFSDLEKVNACLAQ